MESLSKADSPRWWSRLSYSTPTPCSLHKRSHSRKALFAACISSVERSMRTFSSAVGMPYPPSIFGSVSIIESALSLGEAELGHTYFSALRAADCPRTLLHWRTYSSSWAFSRMGSHRCSSFERLSIRYWAHKRYPREIVSSMERLVANWTKHSSGQTANALFAIGTMER